MEKGTHCGCQKEGLDGLFWVVADKLSQTRKSGKLTSEGGQTHFDYVLEHSGYDSRSSILRTHQWWHGLRHEFPVPLAR